MVHNKITNLVRRGLRILKIDLKKSFDDLDEKNGIEKTLSRILSRSS